jgi:hypothetical protein
MSNATVPSMLSGAEPAEANLPSIELRRVARLRPIDFG